MLVALVYSFLSPVAAVIQFNLVFLHGLYSSSALSHLHLDCELNSVNCIQSSEKYSAILATLNS